ncbi:fungal-specific transcription factor domain-containing protein [Cercophora newfieldiana]|uniref:Fungal-specific transcription factor domain-containing protein n=1 Tax=Cercophora newfieldiana TaxID=92897 RepID=A0AA39YCG2_9PEZI|nr:fungal-specific transcription factor domain-containing protein [Cercophora newfieldiana]
MEDVDPEANLAGGISQLLPPSGPELSSALEHKKRNRIRLSCTHCRQKKLKCNRQLPCDQCEKRDIAADCQIIPYESQTHQRPDPSAPAKRFGHPPSSAPHPAASRAKPQVKDSAFQARLKHLEHLVHVLKSQRREPLEDASDELPPDIVRSSAKAGLSADDKRYVDATNWESILDDITVLTRDLKTDGDISDPGDHVDIPATQGPNLLVGGFPHLSIAALVAALPPRALVDRLVARFFEAKEPAWAGFHVPTFMRNYKDFWDNNPLDATYTWIALLFAMCAHGALYFDMAGQDLPGNFGSASMAFDEYKYRTAQCLALSDPSKPGNYKVQTMLLYFGTEYLRHHDFILGTSTLLAMTVRLAVHMGMHRDPKHYPDMPPYEGEIRRRVWAIVREIDALVSFQFGVPSNIHPSWYDTEAPRNLHDEDFDEDTRELPPSRPETERTVSLPSILRGRLIEAFSAVIAITTAAAAGKPVSYAEVMRVDRQLEDVRSKLPPTFRYRPFSQSLVDPVEVIMNRYWLDLLYHKSRIVLHRKYMCVARREPRYEHSRRACIGAATQTLRHQCDIHSEMQLDGRLAKDRWFLNSMSVHGFLLADMILCLELAYLKAKDKACDASDVALKAFANDTTPDILSKQQLVDILRNSRLIWQTTRKQYRESNRAFRILSDMLAMSAGSDAGSSPESTSSSERADSNAAPALYFGADAGET